MPLIHQALFIDIGEYAIAQIVKTETDPMNAQLNSVGSRLNAMQKDIDQINEDTEITRSATNSLVKWAE